MDRRLLIAFTMSLLAGFTASAQKVKLREGSLDAIKGIYTMNIRYDYSQFTVGDGKPEAAYVREKREEYNTKAPGTGDNWAKAWIADRDNRFEPHFREEFENQSEIGLWNRHDAKFTLIFKTTHIEPGTNAGSRHKSASIDGEAYIIETTDPDKVLAKISVEHSSGSSFNGFDFDATLRIQEAYGAAGKALGKYIKKHCGR